MLKHIILALVACSTLITLPAQSVEEILSYHSDIDIHKDSSLTITETITVKAEGQNIKRGIYREFPTNYRNRFGNNYQVDFDIESVTQDGEPVDWMTKDLRNGVRLYIGDSDQYLKPGVYKYIIRYKTNNQLGFYEDVDELYWNVTGNDWKFTIIDASATVNFPETIPQDEVKYQAYTGYYGSRNSHVALTSLSDNSISMKTTKALYPSQGFTIQIGLPKGYVEPPTALDKFITLLSHNRHLLVFIVGIFITFAYYYYFWSKYGRDPKPGVIIPLYDPPKKESPAAMRYVLNHGYDSKTFTTALLSLAVKGYLTIEEVNDNQFLIKRHKKNRYVKFAAGESRLEQALFRNKDTLSTQSDNDRPEFRAAMAAHKVSLDSDYNSKYYNTNSQYITWGVVLSAVTILLGINLKHPFASIGISFFVAGATLMILNIVFGILLKAPTALGRKFMDKAEGLKEYLTIAEGDALRSRYPLTKTPETFERYLPYAFALDIEKTWGDMFNHVLSPQLAKDTPQSTMTNMIPAWYLASSNSNGLNFSGLTQNLGESFTSSVSSAATPPGSSSGSGFSSGGFGGGFSGGGGGGGGGGGW
ncbi:DUF2207 domain-containing protein [Kangiella spongicola]|uniref:DUF2207 domain-containing protein n=1 Tax=Kangiella spongicola TaxID=796379 RepID=A0A318D735_9GAMM|nr:DUF2207 domain-containing protein [Kangiella spongicola]PXF63004.1 hypothetical protein DL796_06000 [Kangiella spongicola]